MPANGLNGHPITIVIHLHLNPTNGNGNGNGNGVEAHIEQQQDPEQYTTSDLLKRCNVKRPAEILEHHSDERIRSVCLTALIRPRQNVGGWVASALKKGWKV